GRPAARSRLAGLHLGTGAAASRNRAGAAHHGAIAVALERQSRLEARFLEHRPLVAGGDRPPPRRIRPPEGDRQDGARQIGGGRIGAAVPAHAGTHRAAASAFECKLRYFGSMAVIRDADEWVPAFAGTTG